MELFIIFLSAAIVNNFVLSYFLGICPFIGVSNKLTSAFSMGLATTFVLVFNRCGNMVDKPLDPDAGRVRLSAVCCIYSCDCLARAVC